MRYDAQYDPSGAPWTKLSVTDEIGRKANELANVSNLVNGPDSPCQRGHPSTGNLTPEDEAACDALQREVLSRSQELEAEQRELQAIAAHLAQGNTPSVVGPGAVNVVIGETGVPEFVTTPTVQGPIPPPAGTPGPDKQPTTTPALSALGSIPMWVWLVLAAVVVGGFLMRGSGSDS